MESLIQISKINDFLFCPRSIYLHSLYENFSEKIYHQTPQINGKFKHQSIDQGYYSDSKNCLQGLMVYSEKFNLIGKIDIYFKDKQTLVERKSKIKTIYEGYILQLYSQYLCLKEMGYSVEKLFFHSLGDNRRYQVPLPSENDIKRLKSVIAKIQNHQINTRSKKNKNKCQNCIYLNLC